ncbi:MAG TPA: hypothetical protein VKO16_08960, partial [Polyangia bacterium]|nr:hypothetical protein [Polyangia bacterium]
MTIAADTITFNIPGAGLHTIALASPLPTINQPVTIDGQTQPGASANTNGPFQGLNSVLLIEINGANGGNIGLNVTASGTTIRGLIVNRFGESDIQLSGNNQTVEGNWLGTSADGTATFASAARDYWGVTISGGSNDVIGGTTPAARNLINARLRGIEIGDSANTGHRVSGNLMGTNAAGTASISRTSGSVGVSLRVVTNAVIGGLTPAERNVISGFDYGIVIGETSDLGGSTATANSVQGNAIGTDVSGSRVIVHMQYGIVTYSIQNTVGGTAAGAGNVVAGCLFGISMQVGNGTIVQGNFIGTDPTGTID